MVFTHQDRTGTVHLPWVRGKSVKIYFGEHPLRAFGLLGKRMTHKLFNREGMAVNLWYEPKPGEAIVMMQARRGRG